MPVREALLQAAVRHKLLIPRLMVRCGMISFRKMFIHLTIVKISTLLRESTTVAGTPQMGLIL